VAHWWFQ